ncbi:MAG: hypothetical protein ACLPND_08270 [Candidatus Korobacteraceae bacterium]
MPKTTARLILSLASIAFLFFGNHLLPLAWASNCPAGASNSESMADAKITVTGVSPTLAPVSTAARVTISGTGFDPNMTLVACPNQAGTAEIAGQVDPLHVSTATSLYFLASLPDAAGSYQLYLLTTDKKLVDLKTTLAVQPSGDTAYVSCDFPGKMTTKKASVGCSYSPLTYETTEKIFGKGIANRFIVVQVTVRNKSLDLEYLLQDIRLGKDGVMVSSIDKKLARRVSENTEQFSARAISFRLVSGAATLLTGIAGVVGDAMLTSAAALVAGPAQTGLHIAIPDLSTAEINTIDDNGFSVNSTVIPKNSAIAVVAFLASEAFAPIKYKSLEREELLKFFSQLNVQIAGIHVQQVDLGNPSLTAIVSLDPKIVAGALTADASVILQGSALSGASSVVFTQAGAPLSTFTAKLVPTTGSGPVDPNVDKVLIPQGTVLNAGDYALSLISTDGTTIPTGVTMKVQASPAVAISAITPANQSVAIKAKQQFSATVTGSPDTAKQWSVNGEAGGDTTVGQVDSTGNYTAPNQIPTPAQVTLKATAHADSSQTSSTTITIVAAPANPPPN